MIGRDLNGHIGVLAHEYAVTTPDGFSQGKNY